MEKKIISDIRIVLINDWDPIGIGDNSNLSDEYDGCIGSIINILKQKFTIEAIATFLKKIEKIELGIDNVDIKYLYDVAAKLKKIGDMYYHFDSE
jgi:hypothetical protein